MDLFAVLPPDRTDSLPGLSGHAPSQPATAATAPERVLAAELQARGPSSDALAMMVSSMVRMVQVGKERDSRWKAS